MLVVTRSENETIHIGELIDITIVAVRGNKVRIGIDAPRLLAILRGEHLTDESLLSRKKLIQQMTSAVDVETGRLVELLAASPVGQAAGMEATA
tara:strand:+ start:285896 stop:286177 length:282 start_codon:yes stop_codon:yes gene_type:complete